MLVLQSAVCSAVDGLQLCMAESITGNIAESDRLLSYEVCASSNCSAAGDSCFDIAVPAEGTDGAMCSHGSAKLTFRDPSN